MKVLKASDAVASHGQTRVLLGVPSMPKNEALREPGRWISEAELQAVSAKCVAQGREEGMTQGRAQAEVVAREQAQQQARVQLDAEIMAYKEKQAKDHTEKWRSLATALAHQAQGLCDQLQAEVTEWTFLAVCRLLGRQSQEQVSAMVQQVLAEAQLNEPLTILLHANDLAVIDLEAGSWPSHVKLAADERVRLGGCLVQSAHQTLDARLEVQLTLLRELLDAARRERQST